MQTPTDAAHSFFSALATKDWYRTATMVDPVYLDTFRRERLDHAHLVISSFGGGVEDAEAAVAGAGGIPLPSRTHLQRLATMGFRGVATVAELEALTPYELVARWLEHAAQPPRRWPKVDQEPQVARTLIGIISETPTLAHAVYRIQVSYPDTLPDLTIEVLTLHHSASGWAVDLPRELLGAGLSTMSGISMQDEE